MLFRATIALFICPHLLKESATMFIKKHFLIIFNKSFLSIFLRAVIGFNMTPHNVALSDRLSCGIERYIHATDYAQRYAIV